jgi:DNA-binding MarR family transcriptional regulator
MATKRPSTPPICASDADAAWRQLNMSRLLVNSARQFELRILRVITDSGYRQIRLAHLHVPRNLDFGGTRLTEMAARSGLTKQAMGELVDDCVEFGLVERRADPEDGRAKIVTFTPEGRRFMRTVRKAVSIAESDMLARIGRKSMDQVYGGLLSYSEGFGRGARRAEISENKERRRLGRLAGF